MIAGSGGGGSLLVVTTGAGGRDEARFPYQVSPDDIAAIGDANGDGSEEIFIRIGTGEVSQGIVVTLVDCQISVAHLSGRPYQYRFHADDETDRKWTVGLACPDLDGDGDRELVETEYRPYFHGDVRPTANVTVASDASDYDWRRRVLELDGGNVTVIKDNSGTWPRVEPPEGITYPNDVDCD